MVVMHTWWTSPVTRSLAAHLAAAPAVIVATALPGYLPGGLAIVARLHGHVVCKVTQR
ncbi:MAG: hypothetical protein ACYDHU_08030 [Acidimicrobiales bacterium]